jgi:hypothetical protein
MDASLLNTLEQNGDTLAIRTNPAKRRKIIISNIISVFLLVLFGIYAWAEHAPMLIAINGLLSILCVPVSLLVLWIELRGSFRSAPSIELDSSELRFFLNSNTPIAVHSGEVARLILMPSSYGQTLVLVPTNEYVFAARLTWGPRLYMAFSRTFCGHAIGLTPNLNAGDFRKFSQALDHTFPGCVSTEQKANRPPFFARLLGVKAHEAPLTVHVPPPLSKA